MSLRAGEQALPIVRADSTQTLAQYPARIERDVGGNRSKYRIWGLFKMKRWALSPTYWSPHMPPYHTSVFNDVLIVFLHCRCLAASSDIKVFLYLSRQQVCPEMAILQIFTAGGFKR